MTLHQIINTVNKKVIDSFFQLELWFDETVAVLNYVPSDKGWNGIQILEHVMLTSHYLLVLIDKATSKSLKRALSLNGEFEFEWGSIH